MGATSQLLWLKSAPDLHLVENKAPERYAKRQRGSHVPSRSTELFTPAVRTHLRFLRSPTGWMTDADLTDPGPGEQHGGLGAVNTDTGRGHARCCAVSGTCASVSNLRPAVLRQHHQVCACTAFCLCAQLPRRVSPRSESQSVSPQCTRPRPPAPGAGRPPAELEGTSRACSTLRGCL